MYASFIGDAVNISFWRNRKEQDLRATLKSPVKGAPAAAAASSAKGDNKDAPSVSVDAADWVSYKTIDSQQLQPYAQWYVLLNGQDGNVLLVADVVRQKPAYFAITDAASRTGLRFVVRFASAEVIKILRDRTQKSDVQTADKTDLEGLADRIVEDALRRGSSDIHIELRDGIAEVFYRIYGQRARVMTLSAEAALGLAGLLFDMRADHSAKREIKWAPDVPMDAAIHHRTAEGRQIQIRFASAPIYPSGGFQMVMRLLQMNPKAAPAFEDLGYTAGQRSMLDEMLIGAQGLVLLVGPTNSGKSTTMQAMAQRILAMRGATIKLESIEDPVEYVIPGACQMPVSARAGFADLLKSTLRHDPDVLMVGEIRDAESAESIKNIVLAGRKVLSTLHAYEAMAAWSRLEQIGVPRDVLFMNGFVSGIIYQRLLPRLCSHCAIPYEDGAHALPPELAQRIERTLMLGDNNIRLHNPAGCEHCRDKIPGYSGRLLAAEIVRPDEEMLSLLSAGQAQEARARWLGGASDTGFGVLSIGHAMMLMSQGLVDPRDVESQVGVIRDTLSGTRAASSAQVRELPGAFFGRARASSDMSSVDEGVDLYAVRAY